MNGSEDKVNANCFLRRNLSLRLYRRCDFCDLKIFQCFGMQANIISLLIILAMIVPLIWQNSIICRISALTVISLVILLGMIIDRKTDELVQIQHKLTLRTKQLEEEQERLKDMQAQLIQQEKLASMGQLAAGVAHELNNPLGGILGYSEFALEKISKKSLKDLTKEDILTYSQHFKDILHQSRRCKTIVQNLLEFARSSARVPFESLNLNSVLMDTLVFLRHQMEIGRVKLVIDMTDSLAKVMGNANQLQQVFTNIILNAIQAMPEGGKLIVSTKEMPERKKTEDLPRRMEITISDTGYGIPKDQLNKIFEPFFTTKKAGQGTGLGLSVSYGIIKDHKGEISVESEIGRGSKFTIWLPLFEDVKKREKEKEKAIVTLK
jgi:two-component system NtrC family sensor kinase